MGPQTESIVKFSYKFLLDVNSKNTAGSGLKGIREGRIKPSQKRVVKTKRERRVGLKRRWYLSLRIPLCSSCFLPLSRLSPRSLNSGAINGQHRREISPSCFCPLFSLSLPFSLFLSLPPLSFTSHLCFTSQLDSFCFLLSFNFLIHP